MASPSKDKGDRAERDFVTYTSAWFPNVRRGKAGGEKDLGDIFNIRDFDGDDWTVQVADRDWKGYGQIEAKAREAEQQAKRAGTLYWCMVVKRAGTADVGRWFVYMPPSMLIDLVGGWDGADRAVDLRRCEAEREHGLTCITVATWIALISPEVF